MKINSFWKPLLCLLGILGSPSIAFAANTMSQQFPNFSPDPMSVAPVSYPSYNIITGFMASLPVKVMLSWTPAVSTTQNTLITVHGAVEAAFPSEIISVVLCNSSAVPLSGAVVHNYVSTNPSDIMSIDFSEVLSISGSSQTIYVCWTQNIAAGPAATENNPFTITHFDQY